MKLKMKFKIAGLLLAVLPVGMHAQVTTSPTVYSSTGGTGSVNSNYIVDYTVGECAITTIGSNTILTQGFQQPLNDSLIGPRSTDSLLGIYNGLTPNGDGKNDTWYISGIDSLPDNTVYIYNRWGELIWKADHYDNINVAWNGKNTAGQDVVEGTYYYAIILKGRKNYKGWVELSR